MYMKYEDVSDEVRELIEKECERLDARLILVLRMSNHPEDSHLYAVLCEMHQSEYVAYTANVRKNKSVTAYYGHYCGDNFVAAMRAFVDKLYDCRNKDD